MNHWDGCTRWFIEGASDARPTEEWYNPNWSFVQEFDLSKGNFVLISNNQTKERQWYDIRGCSRDEACMTAFKLLIEAGQTDSKLRPWLLTDHYDVYEFVGCGRSPFRMIGDAYISFQKLIDAGKVVDIIADVCGRILPMEILVEISLNLWQPKWSWFATPTSWYHFYLQGTNKWH
jgi:hypothetical protein